MESGNLSDIDTPHIIPVDLNAFLEHNARTLSSLHAALGNAGKATHYKMRANKLLKAIEAVSKYTNFWNVQMNIYIIM